MCSQISNFESRYFFISCCVFFRTRYLQVRVLGQYGMECKGHLCIIVKTTRHYNSAHIGTYVLLYANLQQYVRAYYLRFFSYKSFAIVLVLVLVQWLCCCLHVRWFVRVLMSLLCVGCCVILTCWVRFFCACSTVRTYVVLLELGYKDCFVSQSKLNGITMNTKRPYIYVQSGIYVCEPTILFVV